MDLTYKFTDDAFNNYLKHESDRIKKLWRRFSRTNKDHSQASIPPMLVILMPLGEGNGIASAPVILSGELTEVPSSNIMFEAGKRARQSGMNPIAIFFSTEAIATRDEEPDKEYEVIVTSGLTLDDRVNFAESVIERSEDGSPSIKDTTINLYKPEEPSPPSETMQQFFMGYISEMKGGVA